jgi:hypothetical protein
MGINLFGSFCNTLQCRFCVCWKWVFSADLWGSLIVSGSSCFSHCWSVTMSLVWADCSYVLAFQRNVSGNWVWWNAISLGRYYICRGFGCCSHTKLMQLSSCFSSWSSFHMLTAHGDWINFRAFPSGNFCPYAVIRSLSRKVLDKSCDPALWFPPSCWNCISFWAVFYQLLFWFLMLSEKQQILHPSRLMLGLQPSSFF